MRAGSGADGGDRRAARRVVVPLQPLELAGILERRLLEAVLRGGRLNVSSYLGHSWRAAIVAAQSVLVASAMIPRDSECHFGHTARLPHGRCAVAEEVAPVLPVAVATGCAAGAIWIARRAAIWVPAVDAARARHRRKSGRAPWVPAKRAAGGVVGRIIGAAQLLKCDELRAVGNGGIAGDGGG
eukprot:415253-Prymnesium_polylepis.1